MNAYKFTPGQYFKLKPTARVKWLVFSNHTGDGISAVRSDTEMGQKLAAWVTAGSDSSNQPCAYGDVRAVARTFWPHDLTTAELA